MGGGFLPKHALPPAAGSRSHWPKPGWRMEVILKGFQLSGLSGIPGLGIKGRVDSFGERCIPRMLLWLARSGKIKDNKYSEET